MFELVNLGESKGNHLGIKVQNPTEEVRYFLREAVCNNYMKSEFYKRKRLAAPYLQLDCEHMILVEFWTMNSEAIADYVDWLNSIYDVTVAEWLSMGVFE